MPTPNTEYTPIEQCLHAYLYNDATLFELVSGQFYPLEAPPQKTYPYLVYQRTGGPRIGTMGGATGMAQANITIACWARTYSSAKAVAQALRLALNGLGKSTTFGGTYLGVSYVTTLDAVWMGEESDEYDYETKGYGVILPFRIWHQETT